jgi:hypothetical protein
MDADELRDLGRRAANYTGYRQILVLGSQAVHGSLPGVALPEITVLSEEADLAVPDDLAGDTPPRSKPSSAWGRRTTSTSE